MVSVVNLADHAIGTNPGRWASPASGVRHGCVRLVDGFARLTTEATKGHGDPRRFFPLEQGALSAPVVGLAIDVDRKAGPCRNGARHILGGLLMNFHAVRLRDGLRRMIV